MTTQSMEVNGELRTFFCLGAYVYEPGEREPTRGRLIVLEASKSGPDATLSPVTSAEINGCPYSLTTTTGGLIAAAVNSSVCCSLFSRSFSFLTSSMPGIIVSFNDHTERTGAFCFLLIEIVCLEPQLHCSQRGSTGRGLPCSMRLHTVRLSAPDFARTRVALGHCCEGL